jgi:hypothetical protein
MFASRRRAGALVVVLVAVALTACTSSRPGAPVDRTVITGLTPEAVCGVATNQLGEAALPGVQLRADLPPDQGSASTCALVSTDASKQLVKVAVIYGDISMANVKFINKSLGDGGKNSKQECPGGSSLPKIAAGLPTESALICNAKDRSIFDYTGRSRTGTLEVRVEREIGKGAIAVQEAERWVELVASEVLAKKGRTTPPAASSGTTSTLTSIANKWVAPSTPTGWHEVGPQPKVRSINSIFGVYNTLSGDGCRELTSGVVLLPSDKDNRGEIVFLAALGSSTTTSQSPAQLAASARTFNSHREALDWMTGEKALVDQCDATLSADESGFFSSKRPDLIRWSGSALRAQLSAGVIEILGNTVFTASADADVDILDQAGLDSWVVAAEKAARASVG